MRPQNYRHLAFQMHFIVVFLIKFFADLWPHRGQTWYSMGSWDCQLSKSYLVLGLGPLVNPPWCLKITAIWRSERQNSAFDIAFGLRTPFFWCFLAKKFGVRDCVRGFERHFFAFFWCSRNFRTPKFGVRRSRTPNFGVRFFSNSG